MQLLRKHFLTSLTLLAIPVRPSQVVGYLPNWAMDYGPNDVPWKLYTHVNYFAATPQDDYSLGQFDSGNLADFVTAAHANNVTMSLSIGGWGQCDVCSSAVNNKNRKKFVKNIVNAIKQYDLDGVDIDWEYPNSDGAGGAQQKGSHDTPNLLKTFKALRIALPHKRLTAAVATTSFNDASGNPGKVAGFNNVLDYIMIMEYDTYGTNFIGPNSPMDDRCNLDYPGSAASSVQNWVSNGISRNKLILGLPFYGYAYASSSRKDYMKNAGNGASIFIAKGPPCVDTPSQNIHGIVRCGNSTSSNNQGAPENQRREFKEQPRRRQTKRRRQIERFQKQHRRGFMRRAEDSGQINISTMVSKGYLKVKNGNNLISTKNWKRSWDSCAPAPYIYSQSYQELIAYDDEISLWQKGTWARIHGLGGVMVWSMDGDTWNDGSNVLAKSVNLAMGRMRLK